MTNEIRVAIIITKANQVNEGAPLYFMKIAVSDANNPMTALANATKSLCLGFIFSFHELGS